MRLEEGNEVSGSVTISGDLIANVRLLLDKSVEYALAGHGVRHGRNAYTPHAFPAYVSSVAAIEAYFNECFLGPHSKIAWPSSPLWLLPRDKVDKLEVRLKLALIPQVLFGRSFDRGSQPFQDFDLLVRVRNDIVHYKMDASVPSYVAPLENRGIALNRREEGGRDSDYTWPHKLSSSEGVRWAHNTACRIVRALVDIVPEEPKISLTTWGAENFAEIGEDYIDRQLGDDGDQDA